MGGGGGSLLGGRWRWWWQPGLQVVGSDDLRKKREGYRGNFNYFLGDFK